MIDFVIDMADFIGTFVAAGGAGWLAHKRVSINYKQRWQDAVASLSVEKVFSGELEEIEENIVPEHLRGKKFVGVSDRTMDQLKKIDDNSRIALEDDRLKRGFPPADAGGDLHNDTWTKMRKLQLHWGWDYYEGGWYYLGTEEEHYKYAYIKGRNEGQKAGEDKARDEINNRFREELCRNGYAPSQIKHFMEKKAHMNYISLGDSYHSYGYDTEY